MEDNNEPGLSHETQINTKPQARTHFSMISKADEEILANTPFPKTRADCIDGPRPCPWARCKHHTLLDIDPITGRISFKNPKIDNPLRIPANESCVLDITERGDMTLDEIGPIMNLTREGVRQIEISIFEKIKETPFIAEYGALIESEHVCTTVIKRKNPNETTDPGEHKKTRPELTLQQHLALAENTEAEPIQLQPKGKRIDRRR